MAEPWLEVVAWRVKDCADGWFLFNDEATARQQVQDSGAKIEALYRMIPDNDIVEDAYARGAAEERERLSAILYETKRELENALLNVNGILKLIETK